MAKQDFPARRAEPGWEGVYNDVGGVQVRLKADTEGLVHPKDEQEARIADELGLPVARESKAEAKS
jgi:hypothetical protein